MYKRWIYGSNSKLHPISMEIGIYVKKIYITYNSTVRFLKYEFNTYIYTLLILKRKKKSRDV